MQVINVAQGTPEWDQVRLGKITGSIFHALMGNGKTKQALLYKKAAERLTGRIADADIFSSIHTERGHALEPHARAFYSILQDTSVSQVGFIEVNDYLGCSPDGLVGNKGGVEIKCFDNHTFLEYSDNKKIKPDHYTQVQFNMFCTERTYWDYVVYNPNFREPLVISTVVRDDDYIEKIQKCISDCEMRINDIIKRRLI